MKVVVFCAGYNQIVNVTCSLKLNNHKINTLNLTQIDYQMSLLFLTQMNYIRGDSQAFFFL